MKVYKANMTGHFNNADGAIIYVMSGDVSDCGEWIENGNVRWRRTPDWTDTAEEAKALLAPRISEIATAMLRQTAALCSAAVKAVEV
jgi:hypothetical protein